MIFHYFDEAVWPNFCYDDLDHVAFVGELPKGLESGFMKKKGGGE